LVAVGDTKGYTTIFNTETKEFKVYLCNHKNKIMTLQFNEAGTEIYSLGFDKTLAISNVETKATVKI